MDGKGLTGFVLAGGKSSRMGSDKALLDFKGKPLLMHMVETIHPICDNLFVSGNNPVYSSFGVKLVPDLFNGKGPLAGIVSALNYSQTEWNLIISVDVPMVNVELLEFLVRNRKSYSAVVPVHSSGAEPLIALYNRSIIPELQKMIDCDDLKLMNLLKRINTNYLDCNFLVRKFPQLFLNLNRLEDYFDIPKN